MNLRSKELVNANNRILMGSLSSRDLWRCTLVCVIVLLSQTMLIACASTSRAADERPNIFIIFSDDVTTKDLGFAGNSLVRTPRLDRLAGEGMVLSNVFTPTPQCAPSRAALFTGLYPFRNGAHANWTEVKPGLKSLPHYLQSLGYRVVLMGKRHFKPAESFPFEWYDDSLSTPGPGPDLQRLLDDPGNKPLCLIYVKFGTHFNWPHNRFNYDPQKVGLQPYLVDTPETREMRVNYYSSITQMDEEVGRVLDLLDEKGQPDNSLVIWTADHGSGWPHERDMLYDAGINTPFIARWPGKIAAGSTSDALISYVDLVPTLIDIAGGQPDRIVAECGGDPLDGASFLPVLLGEKHDHHAEIFASNTWNVMSGYPIRAIRTKSHKLIWNLDSEYTFPSDWANPAPALDFELRRPVWESWERKAAKDLFASERIRAELHRPEVELYDLRADPHEMINLADQPSQRTIHKELNAKLRLWMKSQGDNGDSAYHKDVTPGRHFLDEIYSRKIAINVRMIPLHAGGGLDDTIEVHLNCPIWRAEIRYTLDGEEPTRGSALYQRPFSIDVPTLIKARGFWESGETPLKEVKFDGVDFRFLYENTHHKPLFQ